MHSVSRDKQFWLAQGTHFPLTPSPLLLAFTLHPFALSRLHTAQSLAYNELLTTHAFAPSHSSFRNSACEGSFPIFHHLLRSLICSFSLRPSRRLS
jgi:hypothetical protein